jgi:prolipoprotein diacylglyceryltransferase
MTIPGGLSMQTLWINLSPLTRSGHTITFFGAGAAVMIALFLVPQGRAAFTYLDVIAPSFPLGFAFAKVGCFLAGCCAGTVCEYPIAVTYPFGSDAYNAQWKAGLINTPDALIREMPNGSTRLLGHAHALQIRRDTPSQTALDHAEQHETTFTTLSKTASGLRSLHVWPIQLMYTALALMLWAASEYFLRKNTFPGAAICLVVSSYGVLRLLFDFVVEGLDPIAFGLTIPQWSGIAAFVIGIAIGYAGWWLNRSGNTSIKA